MIIIFLLTRQIRFLNNPYIFNLIEYLNRIFRIGKSIELPKGTEINPKT